MLVIFYFSLLLRFYFEGVVKYLGVNEFSETGYEGPDAKK